MQKSNYLKLFVLLFGMILTTAGHETYGFNTIDGFSPIQVATIYPNPTTGLVTIYGKNLKQAEVVNMLGQVVASAQNKGNSLTVDFGTMPDGIYFVNVIDEAGRKCTRKMVKE